MTLGDDSVREWFAQLVWPALVGVLAAIILLNNEWLELPGDNQGPASYSDAVAIATPSVVNIYTAKLVSDSAPVLNAPSFVATPTLASANLEWSAHSDRASS